MSGILLFANSEGQQCAQNGYKGCRREIEYTQREVGLMKESLLDEYAERGFSMIPLRPNSKTPQIKWKRNQRERESKDSVLEWIEKGSNLGIVTGEISRLVVVDVDDIAQLSELQKRFSEIKQTSRVKTPRGYHFYFECKESFQTKYNFLHLNSIEARGDGCYVVAPQSVVKGNLYDFEVPLSEIIPLPDFLIQPVKKAVKTNVSQLPAYHRRNVDCIKQILETELEKGFRDKAFFALYNLLVQSRNSEGHAKRIVKLKNGSLSHPLAYRELKKVWAGRYKLSCAKVRELLPFVNCEGCKYGYDRWKMKSIAVSNERKIPSLTPPESKLLIILDLTYRVESEEEIPSISELARSSRMDRKTVRAALKGLRLKDFLK